jgi:putative nucleotidyltransferase with HDIG domain
MYFVPINEVRQGMILAKDVKIYDQMPNKIDLLKEGTRLTRRNIQRLKELGSVGLYLYGGNEYIKAPVRILDDVIKTQAIAELEKLFSDIDKNDGKLDNLSLRGINEISTKIVDSILLNKSYMVNILDLKMYDDYTYHHSLSVSVLSTAIGLSLGLNDAALFDLSLCGLLHDIGKTKIARDIITKPDKLTIEEFEIIKSHPLRGGKCVVKNGFINERIYNGIISHHEKFDGTGYPFSVKGKDIPLFGRIIAVADVYDALTSKRAYREPNKASETIEYIMAANGSFFDPVMVIAFLKKIAPYPINDYVKLSNGKIGLVTKLFSQNPLRPEVKIVNEVKDTYYNLYEDHNLYNIVIIESL